MYIVHRNKFLNLILKLTYCTKLKPKENISTYYIHKNRQIISINNNILISSI